MYDSHTPASSFQKCTVNTLYKYELEKAYENLEIY